MTREVVLNHTHLRNSQGIGMAVAAMAGSSGNYVWPTGTQISSLSGEIADIAKKRGWKQNDINVKNIMTHAEAASGKDGQLPANDNYGPTAWGGDGTRWDLWHLTKDGKPGSGGHIIRNKVRASSVWNRPVPPDAGSAVDPAKANKVRVAPKTMLLRMLISLVLVLVLILVVAVV